MYRTSSHTEVLLKGDNSMELDHSQPQGGIKKDLVRSSDECRSHKFQCEMSQNIRSTESAAV